MPRDTAAHRAVQPSIGQCRDGCSEVRCLRRCAVTGSEERDRLGQEARAARRQPRLAQLAALLLGGAAPDAGLLVGGQGEVEARLLRLAAAADPLGRLDLVDGRTGRADGEEEVGFGAATGGERGASRLRPIRPSGST